LFHRFVLTLKKRTMGRENKTNSREEKKKHFWCKQNPVGVVTTPHLVHGQLGEEPKGTCLKTLCVAKSRKFLHRAKKKGAPKIGGSEGGNQEGKTKCFVAGLCVQKKRKKKTKKKTEHSVPRETTNNRSLVPNKAGGEWEGNKSSVRQEKGNKKEKGGKA